MKQPNILLLLSDQHRWSDLNCYGNSDVISPAFDRLAAEGVRYTRCVSSSPVCCPYRATMQTGLYTHQHGVRGNKSPWLGQQFRSLADYFNDAGYETCYIGKVHWGRSPIPGPAANGYVPPSGRMRWKHWYGMPGHSHYDSVTYDDDGRVAVDYDDHYQPTVQTDLAIEKIRAFGDTPWLVQLNWGPPHSISGKVRISGQELVEICKRVNREYGFGLENSLIEDYPRTKIYNLLPQHLIYSHRIMPDRHLDAYDANSLAVAPNVPEAFRKMVAYHLKEYYGMVTSLDEELARIREALEAMGRDQDTIILYTSDHGDKIGAFCEMDKLRTKSTWHQNSCRVPFIVWGPQQGIGQGRVDDTPINSVDILPTLLDLAGLRVDAHLPGESIADTLTADRIGAAAERAVLLSLDPWRGIYDGRYLYAISGTADTWEAVSLVDTIADPYDLHNLIADPAHSATRERLQAALERELYRTSDYEFMLRSGIKPKPGV